MTNRHNRIAQWFAVRAWRLRCWWASRRMVPGTRVRLVGDGSFRGMTGTVIGTVDPLPQWRMVELDRPVERGGGEVRHVNVDIPGLAREHA